MGDREEGFPEGYRYTSKNATKQCIGSVMTQLGVEVTMRQRTNDATVDAATVKQRIDFGNRSVLKGKLRFENQHGADVDALYDVAVDGMVREINRRIASRQPQTAGQPVLSDEILQQIRRDRNPEVVAPAAPLPVDETSEGQPPLGNEPADTTEPSGCSDFDRAARDMFRANGFPAGTMVVIMEAPRPARVP